MREVGLMGMKDRYEGSERSGFDRLTDDGECGLSSMDGLKVTGMEDGTVVC